MPTSGTCNKKSATIHKGAGLVMAFLQARMGSKRLPGKALMRIQGQSILERAVRRLRASPVVDEVVVLTTITREDDVIAQETEKLGAMVYRGSELDVLQRFQEASERFSPDIIIRATGDNPLIDIDSVERIVHALLANNLDWCIEMGLPYGAATEAITAGALALVNRCAHELQDREHVTLYIKKHPEEFHIALLDPPEALRHPSLRLTVDTPEDFQFVDRLIGSITEPVNPVPLMEYIALAPII
jgi:spore coat polysaccharide biosynthesis protein SpsF